MTIGQHALVPRIEGLQARSELNRSLWSRTHQQHVQREGALHMASTTSLNLKSTIDYFARTVSSRVATLFADLDHCGCVLLRLGWLVAVYLATAGFSHGAAAATQLDGMPVETQAQYCSASSLSARTNLTVMSSGSGPKAGQDFHLFITVVGLNQCVSTQTAGINLQLPAGITLAPGGQDYREWLQE